MGYRGTTGRTPAWLPAPLEDVIDNDVKLGGSNRRVGEALNRLNYDFLKSGTPIPPFLLSRFGIYPDAQTGEIPRTKTFTFNTPDGVEKVTAPVNTTDGSHWVDEMAAGAARFRDEMAAYRDERMRAARLPGAVHDSVADDPEAVRLGGQLNSLYRNATHEARQQYARMLTADQVRVVLDADGHQVTQKAPPDRRQQQVLRERFDRLVHDYARQQCEDFLDQHPAERHTAILRGAMVSREVTPMRQKDRFDKDGHERVKSDAVLWQRGRISELSVKALQEVGLLGDIQDRVTENGRRVIRYPTPDRAARQATYEPVKISQVWYNRELASREDVVRPSEIDQATARHRKLEVRNLASRPSEVGGYIGKPLTVEEAYIGNGAAPRRYFADENGAIFGMIPKAEQDRWMVGERVVIRQAKSTRDDLQTMVERLSDA